MSTLEKARELLLEASKILDSHGWHGSVDQLDCMVATIDSELDDTPADQGSRAARQEMRDADEAFGHDGSKPEEFDDAPAAKDCDCCGLPVDADDVKRINVSTGYNTKPIVWEVCEDCADDDKVQKAQRQLEAEEGQ